MPIYWTSRAVIHVLVLMVETTAFTTRKAVYYTVGTRVSCSKGSPHYMSSMRKVQLFLLLLQSDSRCCCYCCERKRLFLWLGPKPKQLTYIQHWFQHLRSGSLNIIVSRMVHQFCTRWQGDSLFYMQSEYCCLHLSCRNRCGDSCVLR